MESTTDSFGYTDSTDCTENENFQVYTVESLRMHDGSDVDLPILLAIDGRVFDVTKGREFYGPGGAYHAFAGRDATRGMCKFEVNPSDAPVDKKTLTPIEAESLKNWVQFYEEKYHVVGKLLLPRPPANTTTQSDSEEKKCPHSTSCILL